MNEHYRRFLRVRMVAVATLAGVLTAGAVHAEEGDAFVCMEETQEKCDYENKNLELYIKGTDAFDRGRETGDLTEARAYAAELMARNDLRHGKALMKHVYMQFGQGVHKDMVQAYRWVAADAAAGVEYKRLNLQWVLGQMEKRMTPEQLAQAKQP